LDAWGVKSGYTSKWKTLRDSLGKNAMASVHLFEIHGYTPRER